MVCPIETTVNLIGDKWKVLIMRDLLLRGTHRFGELKKGITGISEKMLTQQLRDLEQNGLISRKVYSEIPPRVEYSVTELGNSLRPIFDAMHVWGTDYLQKSDEKSE
ncbi:winged helix-turn-helix transcriptional regulator [Clostridium folliculivorans]|uniref:Transcriptional regulator n=1 Tax=Clostridium folliculivorans TaxID=2886038 RepID=A0A9W6D9Y6_9CLOT|nr:helix-turn-helix domain-containing protein [Clostridium folliculivorans]GKU24406.1 transcriptional regulator [Clostridium folliculivorans]GKU30502.1 transcriptional regulator [Clostridium folliculivorans]